MSNVVPFDTLAVALALRDEAGLDQKQAEGFARVLSRMLVADLVTKAGLIKWLFGTIVAQTGLITAAVKLLH